MAARKRKKPALNTKLKSVREAKGMSQFKLSAESGVAQGYISSLEAGEKTNPSLSTLQRLAEALGVPVTELLG